MAFGVIFDMDGTLVDNMPPAWRAINRALREKYGFEVPPEEVKHYAGTPFSAKVGRWKKVYGVDVDLDYLLPLYEKWEHEEMAKNPKNPKGLISLLEELKTRGVALGVATSTNPMRAKRTLDLFKLSSYFQCVVTMADISHPKPNPEMFLTAAQKMGIDPKHCIVFEDAPSGIQAGKNAGMKVVALRNQYLPKEEADKADVQIDSFEDLSYEKLKRLVGK
jgi:16S rRNA pseudouridine516 synthase